ncbi:tRNA-specific adenosine deaminase 1 [Madurella mycetomatis]|uniref:tRNA-specific adenosine deaminase 1 n=1 Tax=Madurella mycetomatis TaxID=100816 RepID=A0A175W6W7_9PEZI|nr:tRNA-specific adenosine deaminase 1 [Madurella mycetomatis]
MSKPGSGYLKCVALATGMKCLPASKLSQANGVALHDWHAEVLAIRAFNRLVLDECRRLAQDSTTQSEFLRRRTDAELSSPSSGDGSWHAQPFAWREDLTLHMYCSEAPCGDASMELIISTQEDATPWAIPASLAPSPSPSHAPAPAPAPALSSESTPPSEGGVALLGRGFFSHLGIVRRKPARGDAPPTASKSCSDKLALKQCTSLLSSLTSLFVSPRRAYLSTLVLPASQFSETGCRRCFSGGDGGEGSEGEAEIEGAKGEGRDDGKVGGQATATMERMRPVAGRTWGGTGYAFVPFRVEITALEFEFSRRAIVGGGSGNEKQIKVTASNLAVAWARDGAVQEGLIGGVLQGRRGFDIRGASLTSRRKMWESAVKIAAALGNERGELLGARRKVKDEVRTKALKGWLRNTGDGEFGL